MPGRSRDYTPAETLLGLVLLAKRPQGVTVDEASARLDLPRRQFTRYRTQIENLGFALVVTHQGGVARFTIPADAEPWRLRRRMGLR